MMAPEQPVDESPSAKPLFVDIYKGRLEREKSHPALAAG